jgi:hypothetical protein
MSFINAKARRSNHKSGNYTPLQIPLRSRRQGAKARRNFYRENMEFMEFFFNK